MQVEGMFRGWKFEHFYATLGHHSLWIANELYGFKDGDRAETRLLAGLTRHERKAVYRELMREQRGRSPAAIAELVKQQN